MDELSIIRYHWASYVARGGIDEPKVSPHFPELEKGGVEHWTLFLRHGKNYLLKYPKNRYLVEGFVPSPTVKLLVGE